MKEVSFFGAKIQCEACQREHVRKAMHRMHLQKILNSIKHSRRLERRLTLQECYELLSLAEEIVDFGRQVHAHHRLSNP